MALELLEIPPPHATILLRSKRLLTGGVAFVVGLFLWRTTIWQNSIRELMNMEPVVTAYPWRVALIALLTGICLIAGTRLLIDGWLYVHRQVNRVVPRRVSYVLSTTIVAVGLLLIINNVFARLALDAADAMFLQLDALVEEDIEQPTQTTASGSADSLIPWDTIGRQGKAFVVRGPTRDGISQFRGQEALQPLRVYVGLGSRETHQQRAQLALQELQRIGGFSRSVLVIATPTGTGWLDPGAVDTLEYLHGGDTAIVSTQYSYLPSWLTILIDPNRSRDAAQSLFDEVYQHWNTLPPESRPRLYLHGLSLGSLARIAADSSRSSKIQFKGGSGAGHRFPAPSGPEPPSTATPILSCGCRDFAMARCCASPRNKTPCPRQASAGAPCVLSISNTPAIP